MRIAKNTIEWIIYRGEVSARDGSPIYQALKLDKLERGTDWCFQNIAREAWKSERAIVESGNWHGDNTRLEA